MDKIGIILAAGKGSRLNSYVPKPFQLLAGEYLLNYVIHSMKLSGLKKIYVVVSPEISSMDYLSDYDKDIRFIIQKTPRGTGDALQTANSTDVVNYNPENLDVKLYKLGSNNEKLAEITLEAILMDKDTGLFYNQNNIIYTVETNTQSNLRLSSGSLMPSKLPFFKLGLSTSP